MFDIKIKIYSSSDNDIWSLRSLQEQFANRPEETFLDPVFAFERRQEVSKRNCGDQEVLQINVGVSVAVIVGVDVAVNVTVGVYLAVGVRVAVGVSFALRRHRLRNELCAGGGEGKKSRQEKVFKHKIRNQVLVTWKVNSVISWDRNNS